MSFQINHLFMAAGRLFRQPSLIISALLSFSSILYPAIGQDTDFMIHISSPVDQPATDVIQLYDHHFMVVGFYSDTSSENTISTDSYVYKISPDGVIIDSLIISTENRKLELTFILQESPDSFILAGYSIDTGSGPPNTMLELIRINPELEVIDRQSYFISVSREPFWIFADKNMFGQIILAGRTGQYTQQPIARAFYFKVSDNLDSLTFWEYPQPNSNNSASHIRQLNDTTIWSCEMNVSGFQFVLRDSNFNFKAQAKIPNRIDDNFGIRWVDETSFYLLGEWIDGPDDDVGVIRMYDPLDTANHLFTTWGTFDTVDFPAANNGLDFRNIDSIYVGGTTNLLGLNSYFFLLQYDSLLNLRWERFYGGVGFFNMFKLQATSDGGCIMAGCINNGTWSDPERDPVIIKVNNEGYIVNTPEQPVLQARETIVFPNPGRDAMNIRLARQHPTANLRIFNIAGQLLLAMEITGPVDQVNSTLLPAGSYIYHIENTRGLHESGIWIKE